MGSRRPTVDDGRGKNAHVRVQRVGQPDVTDLRTWGAHEREASDRRGGQAMMRLGRSATLLVAFFLLTSATSAYAECAWVLWEHIGNSGTNRIESEPVATHTTKSECEQAVTTALASFKPSPGFVAVHKDGTNREAYVTREKKGGGRWTQSFRYVCLPDTVDPRGAKKK